MGTYLRNRGIRFLRCPRASSLSSSSTPRASKLPSSIYLKQNPRRSLVRILRFIAPSFAAIVFLGSSSPVLCDFPDDDNPLQPCFSSSATSPDNRFLPPRRDDNRFLLEIDTQSGDSLLKQLWQHSDAILCFSLKNTPVMSSRGDNDGSDEVPDFDELPDFVREALSDYSDESVWIDPYFESYDMTRFDDSIYGADETEPRALMFQQIARELRIYIGEEDDREQVRVQDRTTELTNQVQQLDMINQELTERVSELSNAYVQAALERDIARERNKNLGWVIIFAMVFVVVGRLIHEMIGM